MLPRSQVRLLITRPPKRLQMTVKALSGAAIFPQTKYQLPRTSVWTTYESKYAFRQRRSAGCALAGTEVVEPNVQHRQPRLHER